MTSRTKHGGSRLQLRLSDPLRRTVIGPTARSFTEPPVLGLKPEAVREMAEGCSLLCGNGSQRPLGRRDLDLQGSGGSTQPCETSDGSKNVRGGQSVPEAQ